MDQNKIFRLSFIYNLMGSLKLMFWLSVVFMLFAAAWEGIILAAAATMFQSLVDTTNFSSSTFEQGSFMSLLYNYFLEIPEEYRIIVGFTLTAITFLMGSIINAGLATFQTSFSTRFIIKVRCEIFEKLYQSSLSYLDNQKKGSLITMIINESRSCFNVLKSTLQLIVAFFRSILLIGVLVGISPHLTIVVFFISGIFLYETVFISRILKKLSVLAVEKTRAMTVDADESLQGIKLVKLFNLHEKMTTSFRNNCSVADFTNRKQSLIIQWQSVLANVFLVISVLSLIYLNITFSFVAISLMLTFLYTLQKLNTSLTQINQDFGFFNSEVPRLDRIIEFFDHNKIIIEKSGHLKSEQLIKKNLIFDNVSLNYSSNILKNTSAKKNEGILQNISFTINKGQTIALVGESGSGKSSLANLIVKLYEPSGGRILIDEIDLCDFDLYFLRSKIGLVNQDTILFNKSIRDNLMFGNESATEKEMIDASKKAKAHEFVTQFPNGYNTLIGDRGVKLSGGQRQRLNIAQVFLKKPEIMILDEATSNLDTKSEEFIKDSINIISKNCTSIIIAHRLSTVRNANKVIVLEKGRIVEEGDWESLINSEGIFYKMVQKQFFLNKSI